MVDENVRWHRWQWMERAGQGLERNGFGVHLFESRERALPYLLKAAQSAETVGLGGSMTLTELDLPRRLEGEGRRLLIHGKAGLTPEERRHVMQEQLACDLFFTSTNALTLRGHLVNIDATGNRACSMAFGPGRVIVVAGANKIASDLEGALRRIKEVACPPNARRLGVDTPCARTGICTDCDSPQRICRMTTIIEKRPRLTDLEVCLINEELGY